MIKVLSNPNFMQMELTKPWSRESNAFSISIVTRNLSILNQPLITIMSEINLQQKEFVARKTAFNLFEINSDKIYVSIFNKEIGLQFLMYLLS